MSGVVLLPCPFCGGEAELCYDNERLQPNVSCCGCYASTLGDLDQDAIAAWNTRAPAEVSEAEIERASAAVVADGETVFWSIVFGLNADTNEVRKSMVREILRTAIAAARKVHP